MAQQGKKVLLIGCDPKSDTTSLLFGGKACPTIIETSSKKKLAGDEVRIGDVCFKRDGVFAMELGGPEVGRGCGGRGIIHGFETLEKLGFHEWGFDYVLLDFLGDVVCGGFGLPIARDMCQKVIVVAANDLQSLYVANNVCSAVEYFRKLGGNVGVAGMVINKDDGTGEAHAFAEAVGIPVLAAIPANEDIRRKSANYEIVGRPDGEWGPLFAELGLNVATAPPVRPRPLSQDQLLGLFSGDTVGRNVVLVPATIEDMCGVSAVEKRASKSSTTRREAIMTDAPETRVPQREVIYDAARSAPVLDDGKPEAAAPAQAASGDGIGCHAGAAELRKAAEAAGKSETLERYAADYPKGPHDQPQSMCPAFGSLRVGLRMRRTATILSGSACCVYGLTFTSHFYGARRSVGYVPFNSETLVTGKLFEDIREAVFNTADPTLYDAIVITNLCVPTASGVPLDLLPKEINGVRIVGIDVPGFGVPTHAEAKDVLAGAMLAYARDEVAAGPVQAPRGGRSSKPTVTLLGEMFPADPVGIGMMLEPMGLAPGPVVPTREWRELYAALDGAVVAAIHPFYTASIRVFEGAGRPVLGSAPVGYEGTAAWLEAIGRTLGIAADRIADAQNRVLPAIRGALERTPIRGRITLSGYEGSELLVARLLIESGADVRYVGSACPRTRFTDLDREWLEAHGVEVRFRASLEQDIAAMEAYAPDLAIGTTPVVQAAKQRSIPALYFTNLISARPLMGVAGAGSLAQVVNAALGNRDRFDRMSAFFDGVGEGANAGVWSDVPRDRPEFRARWRKQLEAQNKSRKAEEMI